MTTSIEVATLGEWLAAGGEIAFLYVREKASKEHSHLARIAKVGVSGTVDVRDASMNRADGFIFE